MVGVSLVWALLVAGAFYRLAGGRSGRAHAAPTRQEVVATKPLPVGSLVTRASVTLRGVPEELFPAGAFSRVEDVVDRPVIRIFRRMSRWWKRGSRSKAAAPAWGR